MSRKRIKKLHSKIAELRHGLNLTQAELAELVGVDTQTVSNWENNKSLGQFERVSILCKIFGCAPKALFEYRYEEITDYNNKDERLKELKDRISKFREEQTKNEEEEQIKNEGEEDI